MILNWNVVNIITALWQNFGTSDEDAAMTQMGRMTTGVTQIRELCTNVILWRLYTLPSTIMTLQIISFLFNSPFEPENSQKKMSKFILLSELMKSGKACESLKITRHKFLSVGGPWESQYQNYDVVFDLDAFWWPDMRPVLDELKMLMTDITSNQHWNEITLGHSIELPERPKSDCWFYWK